MRMTGRLPAVAFCLVALACIALACIAIGISIPSAAQTPARSFVAPPRSIADIAAILDQQKPDPAKRATAEAEAKASPSPALKGQALSEFYFARAQSRGDLGRLQDSIADCEKAIEIGGDYKDHVSRVEQFLEQQYRLAGDNKKAIDLLLKMAAKLDAPGSRGRLFNINGRLSINSIFMGDLSRAEGYLKRNQALFAESRGWPDVEKFRSSWESSIEDAKARIFESRGRHREAEQAYTRAAALIRDASSKSSTWPNLPPKAGFERAYDYATAFGGRVKASQGRLAEAEVDIRRALLSRLKAVGKYNADTAQMVLILANLLSEQGRFADAEKLDRAALEIQEAIGFPKDSQPTVGAMNQLAATLFSQTRYDQAAEIYGGIDEAIKTWDPKRSARFKYGWARIFTSYYTRNVAKGIDLARENLTLTSGRFGEKSFQAALARAVLASGLTFARRDPEALQEFKTAIPIILASAHDSDDDDSGDTSTTQSSDLRLQNVLETYLNLIARSPDSATATIETLQIGETMRGQSVQNALAASGARAAAKIPAMADLARKEQDLQKEIGATAGTLSNLLSGSPEERDEKEVRTLQVDLDRLRNQRRAARREIERRFPEYVNLIAPKPVTIEDIRATLAPDEAFVAFYLGRRSSFAWAVPKDGPVSFAAIPMSRKAINEKVTRLREALAPTVSTIDDIPAFDVALGNELFSLLLKPIEAGWRPAKSLIVVVNGALGTLPLSLLPTEPITVSKTPDVPFVDYRNVSWLARTHAVTMIPSAASLVALRRLPAPPTTRESIIGFGDPLFNAEQALAKATAEDQPVQMSEVTTRGIRIRLRAAPQTSGVNSADIGMLPRLPDTAEELKSIAIALRTDPTKVLHLGKDANERSVKSADLSRYRIVAFATHGLVPGELDGLTQPALALSAPSVADVDGDGLLTMEEILGLKLNADWVVLSACNTAAGAGEGAEAATGLGRAFFYAGTRALLVTNWSVHTESARELVTDLFRRQSANSKLTRAEALRQAMVALMDGGFYSDSSGKALFSYAHPLFWAPYTIIGDGGREN